MTQYNAPALSTDDAMLPEDVIWALPHKRRHPYYIVAPRYVRTSAGIKVLHLLCHTLNRMGERAYIILKPYYPSAFAGTNPEHYTPLLSKQVLDHDFSTGMTPVVIYPETISGNPFHAPFVVRYVLNAPGLLGGDAHYDPGEFCVAYSDHLAQTVPNCRLSLFFPASDPRVFTPYPRVQRKGSCFYAGKYKYFYGGVTFDITADSTEITRDLPHSQTPEQIAELFRRSEVFYTYENSALAIEAILCECPVVFLPNPWLTKIIGLHEHGMDGMAWGTATEDLDRAKATVMQGRARYLDIYSSFHKELQMFIAQTQIEAARHAYATQIVTPQCKDPNAIIWFGTYWELVRQVLLERGLRATCGLIIKKLSRAFRK